MAATSPAFGLFTCQVGLSSRLCYDPYEMRTAYGTDQLINAGYNGTGRTIVIIDAFQSPTLAHDVDTFSAFYGLPPSSAFLTQIAPDGQVAYNEFNSDMNGWAGEITLDVTWAHAIAPGAKIVLVLAKSDLDADILSAIQYAVNNNLGDVISMSFGENESCLGPDLLNGYHNAFAQATKQGITIFASSGDDGSAQGSCDGSGVVQAVSQPASDPLVSGVGGTSLIVSNYTKGADGFYSGGGVYQGEVVWEGASGGGYSVVFDAPPFQKSLVKSKGRGVPDVAYNADVSTGVLTYWTRFPGYPAYTGFYTFGGTSAGSPQWAAIVAIADQAAGHRLGYLNSAFYQIGHTPPNYGPSFHDITSGSNAGDAPGFNAGPGWDATTGLGSPKVDGIVGRLIALTSPGDGVAAIATSKPHGNAKATSGTMQAH